MPFDHHAGLLAAPQREIRGPRDGRDAGCGGNAVTRLFVKLLGSRPIVARLAGIEHENRELLCLVPGIDGVFMLEAAEEQGGDYEQNQGNRHLAG